VALRKQLRGFLPFFTPFHAKRFTPIVSPTRNPRHLNFGQYCSELFFHRPFHPLYLPYASSFAVFAGQALISSLSSKLQSFNKPYAYGYRV
jgi:hypothetical protein